MNTTGHLQPHTMTEANVPAIERIIAVLAAVACLGVLSYLLIRGEPFADPNLAVIARIFMSLAAAIFGSTVTGFLMISWSRAGLVVRAGGALALFLLTFWGTPTIAADVLAPPDVRFQTPKVIDIRSFKGPTIAYDQMLADKAVVIARMVYTNEAQPAKNAFLIAEKVVVEFGNLTHHFAWEYIVNIFPGAGCWPCIKESVSTMTIPSGGSIAHETLFSSVQGPTWGQLIQGLLDSPEDTITFRLVAAVDQEEKIAECIVTDLDYWRAVIIQWRAENQGRLPAKLTLPCVE